ncbi:hypothetical protein HMPREF1546_02111 [Oscillibacter sp. KLE 1745]|nr:hypothetical protein HMPREF1546_02111 [Oscillibacter sp. KLE 1745]
MARSPLSAKKATMLHNSGSIVSGLSDFVKRKAGQPCCPACYSSS